MKKRYLIIILLISMLAGCGKERRILEISENRTTKLETGSVPEEKKKSDAMDQVYVYICGHVSSVTRVYQVLEKAGGFTKKAKKDLLNLAEPVSDGQKIIVMSKEEYQKKQNETKTAGTSEGADGTGTVDLNSATQQELMSLPGIGDSKAQAIIDYREKNGRFTKIEDLKKVSGIGDATFSNIESMIAAG